MEIYTYRDSAPARDRPGIGMAIPSTTDIGRLHVAATRGAPSGPSATTKRTDATPDEHEIDGPGDLKQAAGTIGRLAPKHRNSMRVQPADARNARPIRAPKPGQAPTRRRITATRPRRDPARRRDATATRPTSVEPAQSRGIPEARTQTRSRSHPKIAARRSSRPARLQEQSTSRGRPARHSPRHTPRHPRAPKGDRRPPTAGRAGEDPSEPRDLDTPETETNSERLERAMTPGDGPGNGQRDSGDKRAPRRPRPKTRPGLALTTRRRIVDAGRSAPIAVDERNAHPLGRRRNQADAGDRRRRDADPSRVAKTPKRRAGPPSGYHRRDLVPRLDREKPMTLRPAPDRPAATDTSTDTTQEPQATSLLTEAVAAGSVSLTHRHEIAEDLRERRLASLERASLEHDEDAVDAGSAGTTRP